MITTIDKVKDRVSKLLIDISQLKTELKEEQRLGKNKILDFTLLIIEQKDKLELTIQKNGGRATPEQEQHLQDLSSLLTHLGTKPLVTPLDTFADFIHVADEIQDENEKNGKVIEVIKKGYIKDEEVIRPTHVIVVRND